MQSGTQLELHPNLPLPEDAILISQGTDPERDVWLRQGLRA